MSRARRVGRRRRAATANFTSTCYFRAGPAQPRRDRHLRAVLGYLAELPERHDYVLVDAPPMFVVGDAATMAGKVDGVIVILRFDQTTTGTLAAVDEFVKRSRPHARGGRDRRAPRRAVATYRYDAYYE